MLPSPMQIDDTITLEIDGKEIDVEVETVPDVSEKLFKKTGVTMGTGFECDPQKLDFLA